MSPSRRDENLESYAYPHRSSRSTGLSRGRTNYKLDCGSAPHDYLSTLNNAASHHPENPVRPSQLDEHNRSRRFSPMTGKRPSKLVPKLRASKLSDDSSHLKDKSYILVSMDNVPCDCISGDECPSEVDSPMRPGNLLRSIYNKNMTSSDKNLNRPDANKLPIELAGASNRGDEWLNATIERAIKSIGQYALVLQEEISLISRSVSDFQDLITDIQDFVRKFEYPPDLDFEFSENAENTLSYSRKNRIFINQLFDLNEFRAWLNRIPKHGNPYLENMHKDVGVAIGQSLQSLKIHQRNLYVRWTKTYRPHRN